MEWVEEVATENERMKEKIIAYDLSNYRFSINIYDWIDKKRSAPLFRSL